MADLRIDIASEFVGAKAFNKADTATQSLEKGVTKLAKTYLTLYGAQKLARASFDAVKAFAADDKASRVLGKTLNNLGIGFGNNAQIVNDYISGLEKQTGVLDDELRPAMDRLLRATGDITKSQQLLNLALDISAGTGKSVAQVSQSLQKAYLGQNAALGRLGVGLSKAELTSSSFEEIQNRLSVLFAGQATQAANTYSGALDKLTVASNNAKEAIGRGFVDALSILGGGGEGGLQNTINLIDKASLALETFIRRFGVGLAQAKALISGDFKGFAAIGSAELNRGKGVPSLIPSISAELKKAAAEKASLKTKTALTKTTQAQTKAIKEQTALTKAGTLFDLEQTGIIAALKGKVTDEERKRLELQLAILTGNTAEASKLAGEIAKSQGLTQALVAYYSGIPDAKNPFSGWIKTLLDAEAIAKRIADQNNSAAIRASTFMGQYISESQLAADPGAYADIILADSERALADAEAVLRSLGIDSPNAAPQVSVSVTLDGQEMANAVTSVQTNGYLSGKQVQIERRTGSFATP
jgi:hypothetical protein